MSRSLATLGSRERQIMDIVFQRGSATAADVLHGLPDPPSYSAVRAMLRLLEAKGFLHHEWQGPRHVFRPTGDPEQIRRSATRHLLKTFFSDSLSSAVAAMLGDAKPSADELERLARLIEKARQKRIRS